MQDVYYAARLLSYTAIEPAKERHGFNRETSDGAKDWGAELVKEAEEKVAEGSQGLGSLAGATGIFGQDSIALVMEVVLDGPVTTTDVGEGGGIGLSWSQVGDGEVGLLGDFTRAFEGLVAIDFNDLL